jgi:Transposase zinc-binding domain
MTELADIFNQYGDTYRTRYGERMLPSHQVVMQAIVQCRTEQLGGCIYHCQHCAQTHYSYHSCQNRHCPKCQAQRGQEWLEKQTALLLPTPYFLLTFTVPDTLRALIRTHQKQLYKGIRD